MSSAERNERSIRFGQKKRCCPDPDGSQNHSDLATGHHIIASKPYLHVVSLLHVNHVVDGVLRVCQAMKVTCSPR